MGRREDGLGKKLCAGDCHRAIPPILTLTDFHWLCHFDILEKRIFVFGEGGGM